MNEIDPLFDEMERELSGMEARALDECRRSAEDMASLARSLAPVKSGALRDSIHVAEEGRIVEVRAAEDDAHHGVFQEYGTKKMRARSFFWPAHEAVAPAFEERLRRVMDGG